MASRASSRTELSSGDEDFDDLCDASKRPDSSNVSRMAVIARDSSCFISRLPPGKTFKEFQIISHLAEKSQRTCNVHVHLQRIEPEDFDEREESHSICLRSPGWLKDEECCPSVTWTEWNLGQTSTADEILLYDEAGSRKFDWSVRLV